MGRQRCVGRRALLLLLFAATPALAQPSPDDAKRSRTLFEEGRRAIENGNCGTAVPKLKESLRLNPSVGAHISLADCLVKEDPLAAWQHLKEAERVALRGSDDRAGYAHEKAAALEPGLALLALVLPERVAAGTTLQLLLDGVPLEDFYWRGAVVAVSPGSHEVRVVAPGRKTWDKSVSTTLGHITKVDVVLEPEPRTTPAPPSAAPPIPAPAPSSTWTTPPSPSAGAESEGSGQRTLGLVISGIGVVGLVVGAATGLVALAKKSDLENACGQGGGSYPTNCAPKSTSQEQIRSEASAATTLGTVSTIAFIMGGAAVVTGVTLYFVAPHPQTLGLQLSPSGARLVGSW